MGIDSSGRLSIIQQLADHQGHSLGPFERLIYPANEVFVAECVKCEGVALVRTDGMQAGPWFELPGRCNIADRRYEPQYTLYEGMIL